MTLETIGWIIVVVIAVVIVLGAIGIIWCASTEVPDDHWGW